MEEVQIQVNFRHHRQAFRMKLGRWRKLRDGQDAERFAELLVASIESQISAVNPPANGSKFPHHD